MRWTRCQVCHTQRNNAIRLPLRAPRRLGATRRQPLGPCARPERCPQSSDGNAFSECNRNATEHASEFPNGYGPLGLLGRVRLHTFVCTTALFSMHLFGERADGRSRQRRLFSSARSGATPLLVVIGGCGTWATPAPEATRAIRVRLLHGSCTRMVHKNQGRKVGAPPHRPSTQTVRRTNRFEMRDGVRGAIGALLASSGAVPSASCRMRRIRDGGGDRGPFSDPDPMALPLGHDELPARHPPPGSRDGRGVGARLRAQRIRDQAVPPAPGDRAVPCLPAGEGRSAPGGERTERPGPGRAGGSRPESAGNRRHAGSPRSAPSRGAGRPAHRRQHPPRVDDRPPGCRAFSVGHQRGGLPGRRDHNPAAWGSGPGGVPTRARHCARSDAGRRQR